MFKGGKTEQNATTGMSIDKCWFMMNAKKEIERSFLLLLIRESKKARKSLIGWMTS